MKITMPGRKNLAVLAAASIVGALGIGGIATAGADPGTSPTPTQQVEKSDGDGEVPDAQEADEKNEGPEQADDEKGEKGEMGEEAEGTETNDGPDVGPDADPNEPGHQDADDATTGAN